MKPTHDSDHTVFLLCVSFVCCASTVFWGKRSQVSSWLHSPVTSSSSLCQLLADVQDRSLYPPYLQGQNGQPSIRGVHLQDKNGGKSKVWGPPQRRASSPTQMPPDTTPSTGPDLVHPSGHELVVVHGQAVMDAVSPSLGAPVRPQSGTPNTGPPSVQLHTSSGWMWAQLPQGLQDPSHPLHMLRTCWAFS